MDFGVCCLVGWTDMRFARPIAQGASYIENNVDIRLNALRRHPYVWQFNTGKTALGYLKHNPGYNGNVTSCKTKFKETGCATINIMRRVGLRDTDCEPDEAL